MHTPFINFHVKSGAGLATGRGDRIGMPETVARPAPPKSTLDFAIAVMFGTFMEVLDTTVVNV